MESLERRMFLSAGDIDASFAADGAFRDRAAGGAFNSVSVQSDGKIIAVGTRLVQLTSGGAFDTTFSSDGIVKIGGTNVWLQSDGKILLAAPNKVYRFPTTGALDTSFGGGDGVISDSYIDHQFAGGKIFGVSNATVQSYSTSGVADASITIPDIEQHLQATNWHPQDFAVQSSGKVLVAGTIDSTDIDNMVDAIVVRLNTDGTFDEAFRNGGRERLDLNDNFLLTLDVQSNDDAYVFGQEAEGVTLTMHLDANGGLIGPFGIFNFTAEGDEFFKKALLDADGNIYLLGTSAWDSGKGVGVRRLDAGGENDPTFNSTGLLVLNNWTYHAAALSPDGKLVVASNKQGHSAATLLRFETTNPPATLFEDGQLVVTGTSRDDYIEVSNVGGNIRVTGPRVDGTFAEAEVVGIRILGRGGDDRIVVSQDIIASVTIDGGRGNDTLYGGGGADSLVGSSGNDRIYGGGGNDSLFASDGFADTLYGGEGRDSVFADEGPDVLDRIREVEIV